MLKPQDDFEAMFNEGAAVNGGDVTEDMAAGLDLGEALEEQAEGGSESAESGETRSHGSQNPRWAPTPPRRPWQQMPAHRPTWRRSGSV